MSTTTIPINSITVADTPFDKISRDDYENDLRDFRSKTTSIHQAMADHAAHGEIADSLPPITITASRVEPGKYCILDGFHRLAAHEYFVWVHRDLQFCEIKAEIIDVDPDLYEYE
jgi:hypothetical protein